MCIGNVRVSGAQRWRRAAGSRRRVSKCLSLSLLGFMVCTNRTLFAATAQVKENLTIALMAPYFNDRHRDVANAFYMTIAEVSTRDNRTELFIRPYDNDHSRPLPDLCAAVNPRYRPTQIQSFYLDII